MRIQAKHSSDVTFCKVLPENIKGRDFIVGDIHGCLDLLLAKLQAVGFDEQKDRLFSVGDLIDRGPQSIECLGLLRKPWFYACLANHEAMMLCYYGAYSSYYHSPQDFIRNGGQWSFEQQGDDLGGNLFDLLELVAQLPVAYHVQGALPFNVCHANIIDYSDEKLKEYDGKKIARASADDIVWSRDVIYATKNPVEAQLGDRVALIDSTEPMRDGLSLTYAGHTPVKKCVLTKSHLHIDMGAYQLVTKGNGDFDLCIVENAATQSAIKAALETI